MASHKGSDMNAPKDTGINIMDFIIPEKVGAFTRAYEPCEKQSLATKTFDEARLRAFFKAYPMYQGDPLQVYVQMLAMHGFKMEVGMTDEPVIFVTDRADKSALDGLFD